MRWTAPLVFVMAALLLAAACGDDDGNSNELAPTATAEPRPTATAEPPEATDPPPPEASAAGLTASEFIAGTASVDLPAGQAGEVSIVATGPYSGDSLPVVVRNNSSSSVVDVGLTGVARSASGELLASGEDQGLHPEFVRPGEIAFGFVYFGFDVELPTDTEYELTVTSDAVSGDSQAFGALDLRMVELELLDDRIVGIAENGHDQTVEGPIDVSVLCFDSAGQITSTQGSFADQDMVEPGGTASFTVDLFGSPCELFIAGSSGWSF